MWILYIMSIPFIYDLSRLYALSVSWVYLSRPIARAMSLTAFRTTFPRGHPHLRRDRHCTRDVYCSCFGSLFRYSRIVSPPRSPFVLVIQHEAAVLYITVFVFFNRIFQTVHGRFEAMLWIEIPTEVS